MAIAMRIAAAVVVLAVAFAPRGAHPAPPLIMPCSAGATCHESQAASRMLATGCSHSS